MMGLFELKVSVSETELVSKKRKYKIGLESKGKSSVKATAKLH